MKLTECQVLEWLLTASGGGGTKQVEGLENSDVSFRMLEASALGSQGKVALERAYWIRAPAGSTENIPFLEHIGNDRSGFFGPAVQPGFG